MTVSRRTVLKGAAAGAAVARAGPALRGGATAAARPRFRAGDRPFPHLPAGTESIPEIKHVVVIMMENHSFDNHFGTLSRPGVDGLRFHDGRSLNWNPSPHGGRVYASAAPSTCQANYHISQSWTASHGSWNYGANNGFVAQCGPESMFYYTEAEIPFYQNLARHFPVCDRYFCSTMAQTYPNRRFLIAASAFGQVSDPFPSLTTDTNPRPEGFGTIFDLLNAFGISWKNYFIDLPTSGLFPYVVEENPSRVVPVADFFADCALGTLPFFSLVDPESFEGSEENPQDAQVGAYYAYQVINAVMKSPVWESTLLLLTFDEHGGYYDHVPPVPAVRPDAIPPAVGNANFGDLYSWTGFRVPSVVVSAWSRPDYVSHTVFDHTSILRFMQTKWNLPALSDRDANANNMLDCLDFRRPAFLHPPAVTAAPLPTGVASCLAADPTALIP